MRHYRSLRLPLSIRAPSALPQLEILNLSLIRAQRLERRMATRTGRVVGRQRIDQQRLVRRIP